MRPPDDGVYEHIEASIYHSWDALSASALKTMAIHSPYHVVNRKGGGETKAFRIGAATHDKILLPGAYKRDWVVKPEGLRRRTKAYTEWEATKPPHARILEHGEALEVQRAYESTLQHAKAKQILYEGLGRNELSVVWTDKDTGLRCKARFDRIVPQNIVDIKVCKSASRDAFARACAQYRYDLQAIHYLDGAKRILGGPARFFTFIAIEKVTGAVGVYKLPGHVLRDNYMEYRRLVKLYAKCKKSGHWPSYTDEQVEELEWPSWGGNNEVAF